MNKNVSYNLKYWQPWLDDLLSNKKWRNPKKMICNCPANFVYKNLFWYLTNSCQTIPIQFMYSKDGVCRIVQFK